MELTLNPGVVINGLSKFNILREEFARLDAMTRSSGTLALVDNNFSSSNNNTFDPHKEEELRRLRSQIVILEREKSSLADKLKTATETAEMTTKVTQVKEEQQARHSSPQEGKLQLVGCPQRQREESPAVSANAHA